MVGAIWDSAHSALSGEISSQSIDILKHRLYYCSFKAAFHLTGYLQEHPVFVPEDKNLPFRDSTVRHLIHIGFNGFCCLHGEYTELSRTEEFLQNDIVLLRNLFTKNLARSDTYG